MLVRRASLPVKTNTPKSTMSMPNMMLKYFKMAFLFCNHTINELANQPMIKNGMPRPNAYARSNAKPLPGTDAANARTDPKSSTNFPRQIARGETRRHRLF